MLAMSCPADPAAFEQARVLFLLGLESFSAGRFDLAETQFLASLQHLPGRVSTLVNLAATRVLLGKPAEALDAADEVLRMEPDNRDAMLHRSTALAELQRHDQAIRGFEELLKAEPDKAETWSRYGHSLAALQRPGEAMAAYERALALNPKLATIWSRHGELLRESNRFDEAAVAFQNAIAHGADPELNGYYLAAVRGSAMPLRAPDAYVRGLFDGYADDFDHHLVGLLGYQAHVLLVQQLAALKRGPFRSALDLGCGTGLCGPLIRPMAAHVTGVDLSGRMLGKARSLGVYDELVEADVTAHLQATARRHDLVVAADVFIYVGELSPVFAALESVMLTGGMFCFTAEAPNDPEQEVQLMHSLRYAHSESYLRRLAAVHGFRVIDVIRETVRHDQRRPIAGLYVYLERV
jgi:predicted TPR repeat methyltransferase